MSFLIEIKAFSIYTCAIIEIPRYNDSVFPKDVAIKMNLLLYRILNEQIEM